MQGDSDMYKSFNIPLDLRNGVNCELINTFISESFSSVSEWLLIELNGTEEILGNMLRL